MTPQSGDDDPTQPRLDYQRNVPRTKVRLPPKARSVRTGTTDPVNGPVDRRRERFLIVYVGLVAVAVLFILAAASLFLVADVNRMYWLKIAGLSSFVVAMSGYQIRRNRPDSYHKPTLEGVLFVGGLLVLVLTTFTMAVIALTR